VLELVNACLLGVIQGITEFLPISSDGHLVIAQGYLPGFDHNPLTFDVMLHLGTLVAVLAYFRSEVWALLCSLFGYESENSMIPARRWLGLIVVATVPTIVIGLTLQTTAEALFSSPGFAAGALIVNGSLLLMTSLAPQSSRGAKDLKVRDALLIGVMQGFAVLPGISRSSNTIATAMFLGVRGDIAAQFSFLLSIPAVAGAVAFKLRDFYGTSGTELVPFGVGAAAALASGLWAIAFLLRMIVKGRLQYFGYYCLVFGGLVLLLRFIDR
jgi:undecaprenyl-diphosphatase